MRLLLTLFLLICSGCAVPPAPADPKAQSGHVAAAQINAPAFRLHIIEARGITIPPTAIERTLRTLRPYFVGPIEVIHHSPIPTADKTAGTFPILDGDRIVVSADLPETGPYRLATPNAGLVGAIGMPSSDGETEFTSLLPLIEPGVALVAITPGPEDGRGVTGYASLAARDPDQAMIRGLVVMHDSVIRRRSNWFMPRSKLYQWTLTHELGHVLGVPADRSHIRTVPGLGGNHCTHPECVMYTGVDWRVVVSGLLHGWPMDFCTVCQDEVRSARMTPAAGASSE
ncbi:MAG: hypothetical protein IT436_09715 [Phycisphaerales bacterium]|nr:hypothetical protein [Phycisphaerales bacterium]